MKYNKKEKPNSVKLNTERKTYICTECGGDATVAWANDSKKDKNYFGGIIKAGERLCLSCGKKRGVSFF